PAAADSADLEPLAEARVIAATYQGVRMASIYAPNGRSLDTPFFVAKLTWYNHLLRWAAAERQKPGPLVIMGDYNLAPTDDDVWDPRACHGGTHVSPPEREIFQRLLDLGFVDAYRLRRSEKARYTWWDYRAVHFPKNYGMRIDHCLISSDHASRVL